MNVVALGNTGEPGYDNAVLAVRTARSIKVVAGAQPKITSGTFFEAAA